MATAWWSLETFCMIGVILLVVFCLAMYFIFFRKRLIGEIPSLNWNYQINDIMIRMRYAGWTPHFEPGSNRVKVDQGQLVSTELFFIPRPNGQFGIYYRVSATDLAWILVIVLLFITGGLGSIVVAIILHVESVNFTKLQVVPMIMQAYPPIAPGSNVSPVERKVTPPRKVAAPAPKPMKSSVRTRKNNCPSCDTPLDDPGASVCPICGEEIVR
jgi:hypothetical protein